MSDPTARRGDAINALLDAMRKSRRGWSKRQIKDFLFERYRYGVREQTLDLIFNQLKDHGIIAGKPARKGSRIILWYVVRQPPSEYNVRKNEKKRKKESEKKKPKEKAKK